MIGFRISTITFGARQLMRNVPCLHNMAPSDSLPTTTVSPFGLTGLPVTTHCRGGGSPWFQTQLSPHADPSAPENSSTLRFQVLRMFHGLPSPMRPDTLLFLIGLQIDDAAGSMVVTACGFAPLLFA